MASNCLRNLVRRSSNSTKTFLSPGRSSSPAASGPSGLTGAAPTITRTRRRPFLSSRLPVELGNCESLMPLHSATASALLKSMLSSKVGSWGFLSEGFATPL